MATIKDVLREFNPWWKEDYTLEFKEREVYKQVQKFLPLRHILVFTGLRRTGKSTLLRKISYDAMKNGLEPKNVLLFSFDEFKNTEIRTVLKEYEELLGKDFRTGKRLLLLDELQKVENWDVQVKSLYDAFPNFKILVSGSESLFLRRESKKTLAGRMFEFTVEPLSFREFLSFKGVSFRPIALYEKELARAFNEFTLSQGLPEMVGVHEKEIIRRYIRESIVEKVIYKDLPQLVSVRDIALLESLINLFMEEPGQLVQLVELAKELGVARQTLSDYLSFLEQSFLLEKVYNFSLNRRKTEQKLKKYYPALVSPDLASKEDDFSKSRVFEWCAVRQLGTKFFWRDPYKNEVDAVVVKDKPIPVEIKYGKVTVHGLEAFMEKFRVPEGYVLSSRLEEERKTSGGRIHVIPAFKFFLTYNRQIR